MGSSVGQVRFACICTRLCLHGCQDTPRSSGPKRETYPAIQILISHWSPTTPSTLTKYYYSCGLLHIAMQTGFDLFPLLPASRKYIFPLGKTMESRLISPPKRATRVIMLFQKMLVKQKAPKICFGAFLNP